MSLLRWLNIFIILLSFLSYLSPYVNPETFWQFSLFGIAYPWLLLANLGFLLTWIVLKKKYFLFSLACIIMGWSHFTNFVGLSLSSTTTTNTSFKVMSFNASYLFYTKTNGSKRKKLKEERQKRFFDFFEKETKIDILCGQEFTKYDEALLKKAFQLKYAYHFKGTSIYSRYPIKDKGKIDFPKSLNSCVWADVQIGKQRIRVYSLHLQSNKVSSDATKVLKLEGLQQKETLSDIGGMLKKIKKAALKRPRQARLIVQSMEQCPYPIILCGDFNDTPQSYSYRILTKNLQDAFHKKKFGLGTTYAGSIPALRIDYILADQQFEILDHEIIKKDFSDHYPIISNIAFK